MKIGLILVLIAGVLSAVFNISLEHGQPISDMAAEKGAGQFEGNAKYIVSTAGCFVVNFVWFMVLGIRQKTLKEFTRKSGLKNERSDQKFIVVFFVRNAMVRTILFYGMAHVKMGKFQFVSWVLHMSMLIFFSYIVGVILKEWKNVSKKTFRLLVVALAVLVMSFVIISYGSTLG